jgi:hypothetical protein
MILELIWPEKKQAIDELCEGHSNLVQLLNIAKNWQLGRQVPSGFLDFLKKKQDEERHQSVHIKKNA